MKCVIAILVVVAAALAMPVRALAQGADIPTGITVDADGVVYVTGASMGADGRMDLLLVAVDNRGAVRGVTRMPSATGSALGGSLFVAGDAVLMGGTLGATGSGADMIAARFLRSSLLGTDRAEAPEAVALECWPNPYTASSGQPLQFRFSLPKAGSVGLIVSDVHGREVQQLPPADYAPGSHMLTFHAGRLPAGMYLARLQGGIGVASRVFVVVK